MPTKRGGKGSPAKPTTTYAEWKARCAALLEGQGISPGVMPERDWRQLFITGATPEQPAEQVRVNHYKTAGCGADAQALTDDRPASQVTISDYRPRRGGASLPVLGGSAGGQRSLLRILLGPVKMQPSAGPILRRLNRPRTRPD
jgi:hypothetical protein